MRRRSAAPPRSGSRRCSFGLDQRCSVDRPTDRHDRAAQCRCQPCFSRSSDGILDSVDRPRGATVMTVPVTETVTSQVILDAARTRLLADGYAGLSTRKVAQEAGVPLSQVHYHFGSKGGMVLALLEAENQRRLARQTRDVRRGRPPVAALRAGVRLPRGRPRVGLRPRAPGDDRRRLVDTRDRRRGAGDAGRLVRAAHRGRHRGVGQVRRPRPVLTGRSGRPRRQRVHRRGGAAPARLRPSSDADQGQPASRR